MNERIAKKVAQIEKVEKKLNKYALKLTDEQKEKALEFNWRQLNEYCGRDYDLHIKMEDYSRAYRELKVLKEQLEKIEKQEAKKEAKERTLNEMPEAMKEFSEKMLNIWNEYDKHERNFYKDLYKKYKDAHPEDSYKAYKEFIRDFKYSGYMTMKLTDQEIEEANKKAVDKLIVNLLDRVVEKTGKIIDARGLRVTTGNSGYAVINGFIKGENGSAVVESIPAGGYNIQRYHIRTLVK